MVTLKRMEHTPSGPVEKTYTDSEVRAMASHDNTAVRAIAIDELRKAVTLDEAVTAILKLI